MHDDKSRSLLPENYTLQHRALTSLLTVKHNSVTALIINHTKQTFHHCTSASTIMLLYIYQSLLRSCWPQRYGFLIRAPLTSAVHTWKYWHYATDASVPRSMKWQLLPLCMILQHS